LLRSFEKLFWGEQPPFMPCGRGGRYFFRLMKPRLVEGNKLQRNKSGWPVALTMIAAIFALLIAFVFFRIETWPGRTASHSIAQLEQVARKTRDAFVGIAHLQPQVKINEHVYLEQTTAVGELALVSRRTEVEHEMLHTWAGSTKRIKLHGTFLVKAGFDLSEKFVVDIRPTEIFVQLPHARILGLEQEQMEVLAFENGFWNRIQASDVESQLVILPTLARQKAIDAGLPQDAEQAFSQRLKEKLHPPQPIRTSFGPVSPPAG
jgi:hypothetical protein